MFNLKLRGNEKRKKAGGVCKENLREGAVNRGKSKNTTQQGVFGIQRKKKILDGNDGVSKKTKKALDISFDIIGESRNRDS